MKSATLTSDNQFRNPTRQMNGVLTRVEKRCLLWLAARMPAFVNSDHLTVLALAAMVAAGGFYALGRLTPWAMPGAIVCLALNWFGDSLDGTLARVRHCERPRYGFYVDHVVDLVGTGCLLAGLGLSSYMSPLVALSLFAAYVLVCAEVFLRTCCVGEFQMSFLKIGPTELRILLAIGTLFVMSHPTATIAGRTMLWFDAAGLIAAAGLTVAFLISSWLTVRRLFKAEPLPR